MPRRTLTTLSDEEDPYTLERYPRAFQVTIGRQAYNARQLAKAAKVKGKWLDMYRQKIPDAKVREILALTGQRAHPITGRLVPASQHAKLRKLALREMRARYHGTGQSHRFDRPVVGPLSPHFHATTSRLTIPSSAYVRRTVAIANAPGSTLSQLSLADEVLSEYSRLLKIARAPGATRAQREWLDLKHDINGLNYDDFGFEPRRWNR